MPDRAFIDLHCHTSASFDSLAAPASVVNAAVKRGLTHLAITDHGTIDGALAARAAAPEGFTVITGEEIRTAEGDLIAMFLHTAVAQGMPTTSRATTRMIAAPAPRTAAPPPGALRDALEIVAGRIDAIASASSTWTIGSTNAW